MLTGVGVFNSWDNKPTCSSHRAGFKPPNGFAAGSKVGWAKVFFAHHLCQQRMAFVQIPWLIVVGKKTLLPTLQNCGALQCALQCENACGNLLAPYRA
jgi:hypothetical protein